MPRNDSAALKIHLLDVGEEKYGDCIVCEVGGRRILIDGAHSGDLKRRNERPSIPEQFERIFGHGAPFHFDLLVVTHCHADHIGCLPALVSQRAIEVDSALVADETLGFGRMNGRRPPAPDALTAGDKLAAALREEDYSHLPDDELAAVLEDIASLESRYGDMLAKLASAGTKIVRYGNDDHSPIERAFRDFGLSVLGPARDHLEICARAIARFNDCGSDDAAQAADKDLASLYRSIVEEGDAAGEEDRPGKGAALNDQSIVLKLSVGNATALLGGDMQFAKPEISGLDAPMTALRQTVKNAGPYRFIKLTHHASYNGFDQSLLEEWSPASRFAHTGGLNDPSHPDPGVLQLLDENRGRLQWARTDHNGMITVTFPADLPEFEIDFGELNDATPNGDATAPAEAEATPERRAARPVVTVVTAPKGVDVELSAAAKVGPDVTRMVVTFEITRSGAPAPDVPRPRPDRSSPAAPPSPRPRPKAQVKLAAGRELPKLLFLTHRPGLENNLGVTEAADALRTIRDAGQTVYEVQTSANPWPEVRAQLNKGNYAGVTILGGYDVLPSQRLDVLPAALRQQVGPSADSDRFIVWNDEAYGDKDGDRFPEVPVSRIPDAKSPRLAMAALSAGVPPGSQGRYGVRNVARPFAAGPYQLLPGSTELLVSEPASPASIGPHHASGDVVYFMLHGSDADGTCFWGEDQGGTTDAVNLSNVPQTLAGVVFAGCCWGALTVDKRAVLALPGQPLGVRTTGQSMALSYLLAGVRAFVGCTGTHYSPSVAPYQYFGEPMHRAFFTRLMAGAGPAQALFDARVEYAAGMPHGQYSSLGRAIELKIWKEFTCLGLGW
jgi:beta-lactamase superfamily II metal-dependent hydrolase